MADDKRLSSDSYLALILEIDNARAKNTPLGVLAERMELLARNGDSSAMSFIEEAKLVTSSDHVKANPVLEYIKAKSVIEWTCKFSTDESPSLWD